MSIELSTSDIVTVVVGALQIMVIIGVAIWTVARTAPKVRERETSQSIGTNGPLLTFLKYGGVFLAFAIFDAFLLFSFVDFAGPVTVRHVVMIALLAAYTITNLVASVIFWSIGMILNFLHLIVDVQRDMSNIQARTVDVMDKTLATHSSRTRRKRRTAN
jgi:hypothetical protein